MNTTRTGVKQSGGGEQIASPDLLVLESLPQTVFGMDAEGVFTFLTASWEALSGYTLAECNGQSYLKFIHPNDRSRTQECLDRVRWSELVTASSLTVRLLIKDGSAKWVEIHVRASTESGDCIGTLTDISERVSEDLRRATDYRSLESLVSNMPAMLYRCRNNRSWTMQYVSGGCAAITGYRPEDLIDSNTLSWESLMHPADRERVWNDVQEAFRAGRWCDTDYRILTADNTERWVRDRCVAIRTANDEILGLEGVITDITVRKRDQDRLRDTRLYDPSTGLPSPLLMLDRLQVLLNKAKVDEQQGCALLLVAVDRFASVTAAQGADAREQLTKEVVRRIVSVVGELLTVSYWRAGQFAVLIDRAQTMQEVGDLANRLHEAMLQPIALSKGKAYLTVSIGTVLDASVYERSEEVLADAETALSQAVVVGGNRHRVFRRELQTSVAIHSQIGRELRAAMDNRELAIRKQPIVHAGSDTVRGFELQLVWNHPRRGSLRLDDWNTGLQIMDAIRDWYFDEVRTVVRTLSAVEGDAPMFVHIPVAETGLAEPGAIVGLSDAVCREAGAGWTIGWEFDEPLLRRLGRGAESLLADLTGPNSCVVLHRFGDGRQSLGALYDVRAAAVKLDRRTWGDSDAAISRVSMLVAAAHAFGAEVVVEGVDDGDGRRLALHVGCDYWQGGMATDPPLAATS